MRLFYINYHLFECVGWRVREVGDGVGGVIVMMRGWVDFLECYFIDRVDHIVNQDEQFPFYSDQIRG